MINKLTISISIYLYGFLNERQDKNRLSYFLTEKVLFLQFLDDLVENLRNPEEAFNKKINKSVYQDCKIIYRCLESSISKSDHGRNLQTKPIFAYLFIFLGCTLYLVLNVN